MSLKKLKLVQPEPSRRRDDHPKPPPNHDESNWLVSYADMMTLLCGFFIMMFAMATMDEPKYEAVKESIAKEFHGEYVHPTQELAKFVTQVLQESGTPSENMLVTNDPSGVTIVFHSTVFFDTLGSDVKEQGRVLLDRLISTIATKQEQDKKQYKIVVEGHTDSRPIIGGIYPSNWELSGARAASVVRMFLGRQFAPDHLTAIGYADTRPHQPERKADGSWDDAALAKNRRVVIRILDPKVDAIPFPSAPTAATDAVATAAANPVTPPPAPATSAH